MSVFWKKIEFYQGKSDCKGILFAASSQGQSPGELSWGKYFWFFNDFKVIKRLTMALKKLYS